MCLAFLLRYNATCLSIFYSIFSFWKTSIESEQCHSNRRLFIIFIFWRKKVKNQPIFSSWDKSDAVDGSHILITLASIRRRGFLSRTKNVLLDPKSSPQNVRSVPILIWIWTLLALKIVTEIMHFAIILLPPISTLSPIQPHVHLPYKTTDFQWEFGRT